MAICPLLLQAIKESGDIIKDNEREWSQCLRDQYAWFVKYEVPEFQGCAISEISNTIKYISINLPR